MKSFKKVFAITSFLLATAVSGQALAECFSANSARNFRVLNSRTVEVETAFREFYRLDIGFCADLNWARQIAFERNFVCPGDDLLIVDDFNNQVIDRCWIQQITRRP